MARSDSGNCEIAGDMDFPITLKKGSGYLGNFGLRGCALELRQRQIAKYGTREIVISHWELGGARTILAARSY